MVKNSWFDVDKKGLAKLLQRKGKAFILYELLQNAWDENVNVVDATLKKVEDTKNLYKVVVFDDSPEGFQDITHAYTIFAESVKKGDPRKRGRFNVGEKMILACCKTASIKTTTGTIEFREDGTRKKKRDKTEAGSVFTGDITLTQSECREICDSISLLIPPSTCVTTFNGKKILNRKKSLIATFDEKLATEISDEEGNLKRTTRKTVVDVYRPLPGEVATIYEMGIPVVETEDSFHVDVQQKIPLNMDRDNVTPMYLKTIRTHTLNATVDYIAEEDANMTWVKEAVSDDDVEKDAVDKALDLRFGEKRVIFDPSDPEANNIATAKGYTVIGGKSMSKDEWGNIKKFGSVLPAGQVTPSDKVLFEKDGTPPIPEDKLTEAQKMVKEFTIEYGEKLMGITVDVQFRNSFEGYLACYGGRQISFNVKRLGHKFFNNFPEKIEPVIDLIIHEFGHEYSSNHLSEEYYHALTKLAAKSTLLALKEPEFFEVYSSV